jgi:hypothetical protein
LRRIKDHAKDHFIPHEGNNHHPHVLRHHVLFGYSLILILLKFIVLTATVSLPSASIFASAITQSNILSLVNTTRLNAGLNQLTTNSLLQQAAQAKAEDMLKNQYFAHTSPSGLSPWYWIKRAGYVYHYSAENLAVHYTQSEDVQQGWMTSPSHRANILSDKYKETGIGIASGDFEGAPSTFVVQMFGTPPEEQIAYADLPVGVPIEIVTSTAETVPIAPTPVTTTTRVLSATKTAPKPTPTKIASKPTPKKNLIKPTSVTAKPPAKTNSSWGRTST